MGGHTFTITSESAIDRLARNANLFSRAPEGDKAIDIHEAHRMFSQVQRERTRLSELRLKALLEDSNVYFYFAK